MHHALATSVRQKLPAQPEQPASGNTRAHLHPSVAGILHVHHLAPAYGNLLDHGSEHVFRNIYRQVLVRLQPLSVLGHLRDHAGPAYLKLVALPSHGFHQNPKMQFAPARHREHVGLLGLLHPQGDVPLQLPEQSLPHLPRGHEPPVPTRERGVVDHEVHRNGGLLHCNPSESLQAPGIRKGPPNFYLPEPRQSHDVTRIRPLHLDALQTLETIQIRNTRRFGLGCGHDPNVPQRQQRHRLPDGYGSPLNTPDGEASHVR